MIIHVFMESAIKFSILIPTLNAGSLWPSVLESIAGQRAMPFRKIIIDSGSTDQTVELARQYDFEVHSIDKKDFNHGRVRQQLADMSTGTEVVVFLTQDAILADNSSIEHIVAIFNDTEIGVAYGRQLPHKNAVVLEAHARTFNYPAESQIYSAKDRERLGFKLFFCSNSFAAYRKSALNEVGGFPLDSIMGEDAIVAAKMLMAGFKKAYVAEARVYHSHSYKASEEFKRYFDTRVFHEQNKWLVEKFGKPTGEGMKFLKSELRYVIRHDAKSIFRSVTSLGAKWLGYSSGKYYQKMPLTILKKLSMHKFHWK